MALGTPAGAFSNPVVTYAPSVAITTPSALVSGAFVVTATFSEAVTGLTAGEITVTNGTVQPGSLSGSGANYTFTVVPTASGEVTVQDPHSTAQSVATSLDNGDSNTLVVTFDGDPPDTTIATPDPDPTSDPVGHFTFGSDESPVTYECAVDAAAFAPCAQTFATVELADGEHTIRARATDAAGNTDLSPASLTWTVDTRAPDTTIATPDPDPTSDPVSLL